MSRETIVVVEDEKDIAGLVAYNLRKEGYSAIVAATGEEALLQISKLQPDLVLLDLMLPGVDGLEVCRRLKQQEATRSIPIIMLTAKTEDMDVVTGLEVGADDYVSKPFSPRILVARVRAVLRRFRHVEDVSLDATIEIHGIKIGLPKREVRCGGKQVSLSATEFDLLVFLARRPGCVFSRSQIITGLRGDDYPVTDRSVDVHILSLRRKLEGYGATIETIRGIGYRMRDTENDG